MSQKGESGCRDDTRAVYRRSPSGEACGESSGDPVAGLASVHAEQNAWSRRRDRKCVPERKPNRIDCGCIERRLPGDGANAISPKELLHELSVPVKFASLISVCVTSASSVPWARRARIVWPTTVAAAERNSLPSAA